MVLFAMSVKKNYLNCSHAEFASSDKSWLDLFRGGLDLLELGEYGCGLVQTFDDSAYKGLEEA